MATSVPDDTGAMAIPSTFAGFDPKPSKIALVIISAPYSKQSRLVTSTNSEHLRTLKLVWLHRVRQQ